MNATQQYFLDSQTTTSASTAAETKVTDASTAAATARAGGGDAAGYEDYSEDEDDYDYADNAIDGGYSSASEDLDAVYKYAVDTERGPATASLDLVPLVAKESQETRSGKELDAVSSQEQQQQEQQQEQEQEQQEEEEFFRPDTVEPRQASSSKLDQATLAETTQPVDSGDTGAGQSKVPQPKALGTSAAGLQRSLSFVSVVAPILCFKYFY